MKKIILFLLVASIISAQQDQVKNLIQLRYELSSINELSTLSAGTQNLSSDIQNAASRKNPGLAILFSMLVPGMGELYSGDYGSGKYFTIADGVLWGVFAGFNSYGNNKEENYKAFAQSKAGVDLNGKDEEYFANLGVYMNVEDYNRVQELNREFNKTYNNPVYFWAWRDENDRKEYRTLWTSSENAFNNVRFVVGALVINRIISAINAVRLVSRYNKNLENQNNISLFISYDKQPTLPDKISLNFGTSF